MTERFFNDILTPHSLDIQKNTTEISEVVKYPINASQLWAHLIQNKHPNIAQVFLAYYYTKSRRKEEVRMFDIKKSKLIDHLKHGGHPPSTIPPSTSYLSLNCSISSIVGTTNSPCHALTTEMSPSRRKSKLRNPRSFVNLDFSCEMNDENLAIITDVLSDLPTDSYILASGNSYHAIVDELLELNYLPWVWGDAMAKFSKLSDSEHVQAEGVKIAESLKTNSNSTFGLKNSSHVLLSKTIKEISNYYGGYNEFSKHTFLDWGHIAYSLQDLLSFHRDVVEGTSYLRISAKKDLPPPILAAHITNGEINFCEINGECFTRQPQLVK